MRKPGGGAGGAGAEDTVKPVLSAHMIEAIATACVWPEQFRFWRLNTFTQRSLIHEFFLFANQHIFMSR